ncbi:uncharacterized protein N0V89_009483 [Didymosphaeria variabile]|uniref:N-acetyltransferase domain-containing protein n=1 Tax=Didymosphaeria variabile TaxID=1932322 RepID=A0A9W8XF50_9PLEO|nr:uncharacterized protein N0V89_009483 [Didymosphaeria variabile]KAJ4348111.1 hypothetical protein N0V89_009483 [Didymosphaeria variabile]
MASSNRKRSASDDLGEEHTTRRKVVNDADGVDKFTVQVALRSNSKAERNDPKPAGYWKTCFQDVAKSLRAEKAGESVDANPMTKRTAEASQNIKRRTRSPLISASEDESSSQEEIYFSSDDEGTSDQASEDDEFAEFRWLEQMDGTVEVADPANPNKPLHVGYCNAKLIRRRRMQSFYSDLEQPSQETSNLAFELFDRYGRLKKMFKEQIIKKGSGIWGDEFDHGDLLLLEYISIQEPYRRQGLGHRLVTAVLDETRGKSKSFFAVVAPGWLNAVVKTEARGKTEEETGEIQLRHQLAAERFYRSLGFRRVGSSAWLALASSSEHPCHKLDADADFELPTPAPRQTSSETLEVYKDCIRSADGAWRTRLQEKLQGKAHGDPAWHAVDNEGNSFLHCAATTAKPQTVSWLLQKNPDLQNVRNDKGETALDALEMSNEEYRTKRVHAMLTLSVSDKFMGFSEDTVLCLAMLKGLTAIDSMEKMRLKYGCTCGICVGGFFSPRMRFALRNQAEYMHDILDFSIDQDMTGGDMFVEEHSEELRYVLPYVRDNLRTNKSMRQGFSKLFTHFATVLRIERSLPTEAAMHHLVREANEWPPNCKNYLQRGGTVYAVGSSLFEHALERDEIVGDGDPMMMDDDDDTYGLGAELASLPVCRNDLEYGFVSAQLGYKMVSQEYYNVD